MSTAPHLSPMRTELRESLRLAAPLVLANLLQMAVYAIDVIFVARLGAEALAAASLSTSLFGLLVWASSGLTGSAISLIAAELGRGRHALREVRRTLRMALWLSGLAGLAGMAICAFGESIMLATGQTATVAARAGAFLALLLWSLIPQIGCNVLRGFVAALGRPVVATLITALAIVINAIGNYMFVFGNFGAPAMGLEGSALSTLITSVITLLAYAAAIQADRRMRRYHAFGRWWRAEWQRFREIVRLGVPIALIVVAEGGFFGSAAFLMGLLGPEQLAGHAVALQVAAFAFQVPFGVGQAATIRVGYRFGAGDRAGAGRAGWAGLVVCILFAGCAALTMLLFPRAILSVYVDVSDPANVAMLGFALIYLRVGAAFQLFDGIQAVAAGALRGLQDTRVPMQMALFGYWVIGFGAAVLLGFRTPLGGLGVWFGLALGLVVVAALLLWRWYRRERLGLFPR
ncbi:MAG: MATE family efflux transporter [Novosphingobium sp.]